MSYMYIGFMWFTIGAFVVVFSGMLILWVILKVIGWVKQIFGHG